MARTGRRRQSPCPGRPGRGSRRASPPTRETRRGCPSSSSPRAARPGERPATCPRTLCGCETPPSRPIFPSSSVRRKAPACAREPLAGATQPGRNTRPPHTPDTGSSQPCHRIPRSRPCTCTTRTPPTSPAGSTRGPSGGTSAQSWSESSAAPTCATETPGAPSSPSPGSRPVLTRTLHSGARPYPRDRRTSRSWTTSPRARRRHHRPTRLAPWPPWRRPTSSPRRARP